MTLMLRFENGLFFNAKRTKAEEEEETVESHNLPEKIQKT